MSRSSGAVQYTRGGEHAHERFPAPDRAGRGRWFGWLGGEIAFFLAPVRPALRPRLARCALLGAGQAAVLAALALALGLRPAQPVQFVLFLVLTAWAFMALHLMLAAAFGWDGLAAGMESSAG